MKITISMRRFLIDCYLDYWNDFITIEGYASHYDISCELAENLINTGREFYNLQHRAVSNGKS